MPDRTSTLARRTTSGTGSGVAAARFCFRRRRTFSTSTTASSTSSPLAIARPPRVMTLRDWPSSLKIRIVTASDSGMATSEISVVRADSRKANSTIATMIAPSRRASLTLPIDASMKSACRNSTFGAARPLGMAWVISASAVSMARVSCTVSVEGCFCTLTMTAGAPSWPASPRFMAGAKRTVATCSSSTARPSFQATAMPRRSSTRFVRPR